MPEDEKLTPADPQDLAESIPYYHVVFTAPAAIGAVAFHNKAAVYHLLFRTAAETLTAIARRSQAPGRTYRRVRRPAEEGRKGPDMPNRSPSGSFR
jgi:hypothetical protein